MKIDKYALKSEANFTTFEFTSISPKGQITKQIQFQNTDEPYIYNLAFGDKNPATGEINDLIVSNNGDTEKVLATVIATTYIFFDQYPEAYLYATGSSNSRTRLYRMGITKFYKEMVKDFYLYGQIGDDFVKFEIGVDYSGFLCQRKFN